MADLLIPQTFFRQMLQKSQFAKLFHITVFWWNFDNPQNFISLKTSYPTELILHPADLEISHFYSTLRNIYTDIYVVAWAVGQYVYMYTSLVVWLNPSYVLLLLYSNCHTNYIYIYIYIHIHTYIWDCNMVTMTTN